MKYAHLPHTDIEVSKICLGTMTWGNQNTEAEGHEQMDYALDQGINFFDVTKLSRTTGFRRASIIEALEGSLKRLQTD